MEQLQHICTDLRDNEIAIIEKYGNSAKDYTIKFTSKIIFYASMMH